MDLAALIDLEWLLRDGAADSPKGVRDGGVADRVARERGVSVRELRARLDADPALRADLAEEWLDTVRNGRNDLPGERVVHGLDVAGWLLIGIGLLLGGGASKALLAYDGTTPVNVLWFVFVLCAGQIALLVLMLFFILRTKSKRSGSAISVLHRPIAALASRFFGEGWQSLRESLRAMRSRQALFADVERWTLFSLAQRFGVAFNVGALVVALATIAFSDLKFSWSTTLDVTPETVHAGVRAISAPWAWLPSAIPSLDVVDASQWDRMAGAFITKVEDSDRLVKQWWTFLIAGVVAWGLVPRTVALVLGSWFARRGIRAYGFDHVGYQGLFDRLLPVQAGWSGPSPEDVEGVEPTKAVEAESARAMSGASTWVLLWGSAARHDAAVRDELTRRYASDIRAMHGVGGADLGADERAVDALGREAASRVILVAAAGQQPTREVLDFVLAIRRAVGAGKPIVAVLLEFANGAAVGDALEEERAQWRRSLGTLDDPHVYVATGAAQ
ncbi:MAG: DUF2868 domain-containing protein [Planctomycetes bacterium]|nr:DUF2868 domain-containing protein [Planctomycetota bacterium]